MKRVHQLLPWTWTDRSTHSTTEYFLVNSVGWGNQCFSQRADMSAQRPRRRASSISIATFSGWPVRVVTLPVMAMLAGVTYHRLYRAVVKNKIPARREDWAHQTYYIALTRLPMVRRLLRST